MDREALERELAELEAKNEAATGWGAAVGARHERIKEIRAALAACRSPADHPVSQGMLRTQEIMCVATMEAKITELAHRFWSIHPSSLDDMGLTREEFYASEIRKLLALRTPAEGERQRCMEILEDVPGETLVDRVNRLKDWHQELSNSYHDAIAEARTERDQAVSQVEDALKSLETEKLNLLKRREIHDWRPGTEAWDRCFGELAGLNRAVEILNTSAHSSTVSPSADICACGKHKLNCTYPYHPCHSVATAQEHSPQVLTPVSGADGASAPSQQPRE